MAPLILTATNVGHAVTRAPVLRAAGTGAAAVQPSRSRALEASALPWYPAVGDLHVGEGSGRCSRVEAKGVLPPSTGSSDDQCQIERDGIQILAATEEASVAAESTHPHVTTAEHAASQPVAAPGAQLSVAAVSSLEWHQPSAASTSQPACPSTTAYSERCSMRCNSVTVKTETSVKDAAGAIVHVLDRIFTLFMTALRSNGSHESLNRAVKSLAVARKYIRDTHEGWELSFLPLHRTPGSSASNCEVEPLAAAAPDGGLFAFLVFKTVVGEPLKQSDETDLNVSRSSDANKMANAIISIVLDRGQAVMKAGGADALFVAMSAVINARHRLQRKYGFDLMMVPAWMTEDTTSALGRESKFLRFNILKCPLNGPMEHTVRPVLA